MSVPTAEVVSDLLDPATVQAIADEVWNALFEGDVLLPAQERLGDAPGLVAASVAVRGPWSGSVDVTCSIEAAEDVTRWLLRLRAGEDVTDEDIEDAFGELANVLGGNVKAVLPGPAALGLPQITVPLPAAPAADTCRIDVRWREHQLAITVQGPTGPGSVPTRKEHLP